MRSAALIAAIAALSACAMAPEPVAPGSRYVAMGSSFAAGPGIPTYVDTPPAPCSRSDNNYAHHIARRKGLALTDVSCSGGTTAHLLGPRDAIAPQLDAVTADTKLVTITIGGNDLFYMSRLVAASCATVGGTNCANLAAPPVEDAYASLAARMDQIAKDVRRRAPSARLVFVDYLAVLPASGVCAATPLSVAEADADREIARRLADITASAAVSNGADVLKASKLSENHDACAAAPWINGYPRPGAPIAGTAYHPNAAGMTAIADALEKLIWR